MKLKALKLEDTLLTPALLSKPYFPGRVVPRAAQLL